MKYLVLIATLLALSSASDIFSVNYEGPELRNLQFDLDEDEVREFVNKIDVARRLRAEGEILAVLNEYADKIFANIEAYSLSHGLDPVNLTNVGGEFLTFQLTMTQGLLHGISTIERRASKDVELEYIHDDDEIELYIPLLFSNLNFTYDYHLIILLIGPSGSVTGRINNFEMDIKLGFNFNTYHAEVLGVDTTDTGHIDLLFHGNEVLDDVIDVLTEFVTTILHPLIVRIIEGIVSDVLNDVVGNVNNAIDNALSPSTAAPDAALVF